MALLLFLLLLAWLVRSLYRLTKRLERRVILAQARDLRELLHQLGDPKVHGHHHTPEEDHGR